ncbi:hypothetical protein [Variovorax sp. EBFNA2]|uniref:hypothetical protein n=1 Tax=Variovorax sp. EBFNA2 TaxID=3342097 RepID=UPI0029BFBB33|nr:hypothetical protein [Variovorax boronicumulans]WPG40978.1 hypothetical protein RZE79_33300 [Variovorax boronicumulans]
MSRSLPKGTNLHGQLELKRVRFGGFDTAAQRRLGLSEAIFGLSPTEKFGAVLHGLDPPVQLAMDRACAAPGKHEPG